MLQWLEQIPAERVLLWVFLAGIAWRDLAAARRSLREQGRRIGALASRIATLEAHAGIPRVLPEPDSAGDGR